jgi:hypothetical protein
MAKTHASARPAIAKALSLDVQEWAAVIDAAQDAHMDVLSYCRLMILAAAGHGGVTEHLERAIDASAKV